MKLEPGLLIASGKYRLRACLGFGGQAEVWEAEQQGLAGFSKRIVLKLVAPGHRDQRLYQNLLREAQLSSLFHHPNVAEVYDVGEDAGLLYIAMERIHGRDLELLLEATHKQGQSGFPWHLAVGVVIDICKGLSHVHSTKGEEGETLHLVHRDIKPSNILLNVEGFAKLIDFGVAKTANMTKITQQGAVRGTPAYMAPEQIRSLPVDKRSDLFSLGALLYELCTGRRAFDDDELYALFFSVLSKKPTSPKERCPDLPDALEEVIYRALNKKPEGRFQDADEFKEALEKILRQEQKQAGHPQLAAYYKELVGAHASPIRLIEQLDEVRPLQRTVTYGIGQPKEHTLEGEDAQRKQREAQEQLKQLFPALSPEVLDEPVLTLTPKKPKASAGSPVTEQSIEVPLGVLDMTGEHPGPPPSFDELTQPAFEMELTAEDETEAHLFDLPAEEAKGRAAPVSVAMSDTQKVDQSIIPAEALEQAEAQGSMRGRQLPADTERNIPPPTRPRPPAPSLFPSKKPAPHRGLMWLFGALGAGLVLTLALMWGSKGNTPTPDASTLQPAAPLRPMLRRAQLQTPRPKALRRPTKPTIPDQRRATPPPRPKARERILTKPTPQPPQSRPKAKPRHGWIRFRLRPSCTLYGRRGRLGRSRRLRLKRAPGWHRFRCINRRKKLYKRLSVKVRAGQTITYRRRFRRGKLFLVSYPWAAVHLYPFGKIGFSQAAIPMWSGRYRLTLYKKGSKRHRKRLWIRIRPGRTTKPKVIRW